jgi:hypothetical protein
MAAKIKEFQLEKLEDLVSLPNGKAAMYREACVWCMDKNGHINGVDIDVIVEKKNLKYQILWVDNNIDIQKIRAHYNIDDALPFGAEAIAFFVCITNTNYDLLNRAIKRTGIDYWLGYKNANPNLPFQNAGRLEISGILTENETNTVEKRIKEKIKQTIQSEKTTLPVYIVVVAFDRPYAKMVVKNANS